MADPKTKTPDSHVGLLKWNPATNKWLFWDGAITGFPTAAALSDATANPTTSGLASYSFVFNGATWDRHRGTVIQGAYVSSPPLSIRMDDGATYLYVGKAIAGSATSDAVWQVMRITQADTTVMYADGDALFDNDWDNHASHSYS